MTALTDESVWPTWYTVQVWNAENDLFMRTSYPSKELAQEVARNLNEYYDGRMHAVTLRRWVYSPSPMELGEEE